MARLRDGSNTYGKGEKARGVEDGMGDGQCGRVVRRRGSGGSLGGLGSEGRRSQEEERLPGYEEVVRGR